MAKIDITNYKVLYTDTFFFDSNIWLLLFGTIVDFQKTFQRKYSAFLSLLIEKDKPIHVTTLIISEITNVLLRIDFNRWKERNHFYSKDFKRDFVGTQAYLDSVKSISIIINKILTLPNVIKINDDFHIMAMGQVLTDLEKMDFNDSVYTALCRVKNYKLVSNDADFFIVSDRIDLITALV